MIIKRFIIDQLVNAFNVGTPFAAIKSLVADLENSDLPGADRKAKVLADFEQIGYGLASWIVDTLLQLALLYPVILMCASLLIVGFLVVYPLYSLTLTSFQVNDFGRDTIWGFDNWQKVFNQQRIGRAILELPTQRLHRQIVGHQQAIKPNVAADDLVHDGFRPCAGRCRINRRVDDMRAHRHWQVGVGAKWREVDAFQLGARRINDGKLHMAVGAGASRTDSIGTTTTRNANRISAG